MSPTGKPSLFKIYTPFLMPILFLIFAFAGIWLTVKWVHGVSHSHRGKIGVPATRANIPAYTKINRDHLTVIYLDPKKLPESVYRENRDVIGRILGRDKRGAYVFTEEDFLPKGARAGIVGGIPPGKRAFTIHADKVQGLHGLNAGDSFDLMGILKMNQKNSTLQVIGQSASITDSISQPTPLVKRGTVVVPVRSRSVTYTQSSLTRGTQVRNRPVEESVIAVSPSEVEGLAQAVSMGAEMYVIPISGQIQDEAPEAEGEAPVSSGLKVIETLKGSQRNRVAVPSS